MSEIERLQKATNATIYERTRFGTGDIFVPLIAERAAWRAEVNRLREALQKVVNYLPATNEEFGPKFKVVHSEITACAECAAARKRQWPPSMLCDQHYSAVERLRDNERHRREFLDVYGRVDIARAALEPQP